MNAPSPRKSFVSIAIVGAAGVLAAGPALADIKIGFNVPLTGFAAADGQSSLNGAKLAALMKKQGMSDREVLASATTVAAKVLGMDSQIGKLAPGYSADIIAVDGNPLADVTVLEEVDFVMVRGRVIE